MTDKQQIEKMAKVLCGITKACKDCKLNGNCLAYNSAEALYNAGYRKIGEDVVVLTSEEWRDLHKGYGGMLYEIRQEASKETAKEIVENIKTLVEWGWEMSRIEKWICKNYGVEVEE